MRGARRPAHTFEELLQGIAVARGTQEIEPMAARLDPKNVQPVRQSLHHLVAKAPWSDEILLDEVRNRVLPAMQNKGQWWPGSWMTPAFRRKARIRWGRASVLRTGRETRYCRVA